MQVGSALKSSPSQHHEAIHRRLSQVQCPIHPEIVLEVAIHGRFVLSALRHVIYDMPHEHPDA